MLMLTLALTLTPSLIPGVRKHHKGPRPATLSKKQPVQKVQKLWMVRRGQLFPPTSSTGTGSGSGPQSTGRLQQLPTERSRDNRMREEKMAVLDWVCLFFFLIPFAFSRATHVFLLHHISVPGAQDGYQVLT
jgi:hypothetical protein